MPFNMETCVYVLFMISYNRRFHLLQFFNFRRQHNTVYAQAPLSNDVPK
jgi:hypothetical protein